MYYWNGERVYGRLVTATVPEWREGDAPQAWWREFSGTQRKAVLLKYYDQTHLLDNEDGSGLRKVTEGHGGPRWPHKDLPTRSDLVFPK